MALNSDDARVLADQCQDAASAIRDRLRDDFDTSDSPEYQRLKDLAMTLVLHSSAMTTAAVGLAIDDMADDAAELKQVTTEAKESLAKLQTVGRVINIAAALVDLAAAVADKNPGGAAKAAKGLRNALKEDDA